MRTILQDPVAILAPSPMRQLVRAFLIDWARTRQSVAVLAQRRAFNLISERDATAQLEALQRDAYERASILARQLDPRTLAALRAMMEATS
jgi:ribonuclease D